MNIEEELAKIDYEIQRLESKKKLVTNTFIKERNEKDQKTIIKYYDKLMKIYNSKHPALYDNIIVSCFKIKTMICCGAGGSIHRIYLSDLLKLWSNGFLYEGYPIVNVMLTNSGHYEICFIKDGKINSVNDINTYLDIHPYYNLPNNILGSNFKPKETYSRTSVSDLFIKD